MLNLGSFLSKIDRFRNSVDQQNYLKPCRPEPANSPSPQSGIQPAAFFKENRANPTILLQRLAR
jgi:hypothetical protein